MVSFLIRKMWKNKWLMLSLLIGNILLVGIVSGTPLYSEAIIQRVLIKNMQQMQLEKNAHPATAEFRYNLYNAAPETSEATYYRTRDEIVPRVLDDLGIPVLNVVENLVIENITCTPAEQREEPVRVREISLMSFEGQAGYLKLLQGRMPSDSTVDGNIIECIASETAMARHDFILDELMSTSIKNLQRDVATPTLYMRVVGIYEAYDETGLFWSRNPNSYTSNLLVSDRIIGDHFIKGYNPIYQISSAWAIMLDYNSMRAESVPRYQAAGDRLREEFNSTARVWGFSENYSGTLEGYSLRASKLSLTLLVLQLPLYVLMAFYIFMVSRQILGLEQNDISVLKSRGAGRRQIFTLYLLQSLFVGALSLAAGIPLGIAVCRVVGSSSGFLDLVSRYALTVRLSRSALIYSCVAVSASILMMLAPVVRFSRVAIVDYKRNKYGRPKRPLWQRFFLDVLCFGVAVYALYNYNSQHEIIARAVTDAQAVDPVLLVSSSLFIVGMGLLCLRLFPLLVRLVFFIGKRSWPPALHVSLLKIIRSAGEEQFVMIFLVFTLAVGIFGAKAARTINQNNDDQIMYRAGADLVFAEGWGSNMPASVMGERPPADFQLIYYEPDFERFTGFDEVDAIAQVQVGNVNLLRSRFDINDITLMAIDTKTFGEALWYRDDLLPAHINYFLNALASQENGVLLSSNFKTQLNYRVGQTISYNDKDGDNIESVVCGFVDRWPGYTPMVAATGTNNARSQKDLFLVVANLGYVRSLWGMRPYRIWMKTNTPTNSFIYDFIEENNLRLAYFEDAKTTVVESKSDPILQGTNGVLTVGFIASLVVCFSGFLIYWILSIKSRVLQFGTFRAMGMTMRNILGILINEQLLTTLTAAAIGVAVGEASSRLFVPLIQLSYNASEQIIPLRIYTERQDYVNLLSVIGFMIVVCLAVLGAIISKLRIAQALKLGED